MAILVQHDICVGGVDAAVAGAKEIHRTAVPIGIARVVDVDARRQPSEGARRQEILCERVSAIDPDEGACLRQLFCRRGVERRSIGADGEPVAPATISGPATLSTSL